jgi:hypothetical protein
MRWVRSDSRGGTVGLDTETARPLSCHASLPSLVGRWVSLVWDGMTFVR